MSAKTGYQELNVNQHKAVMKVIGEQAEHAKQAMFELAGGEKDFYETFVVKVFQCGQATYRMPEAKIMGQWKDKTFTFTKFEKGQEVDKKEVTEEKEATQEGPDIGV